MMGWREFTSRRNSSCLFWRGAAGFTGTEAIVPGACVTVWPEGAPFGSVDKAKSLVERYKFEKSSQGAIDGPGTGYQSKEEEEVRFEARGASSSTRGSEPGQPHAGTHVDQAAAHGYQRGRCRRGGNFAAADAVRD